MDGVSARWQAAIAAAARLLWIVEIKLISIQYQLRGAFNDLCLAANCGPTCPLRVQTCQKSAMTAGQECCHFPAELCPMQSINLLDMISDDDDDLWPTPWGVHSSGTSVRHQTIDDRAPD